MPAYNAEKTLKKTIDEIPNNIVDKIIVVDDHSQDKTARIARKLPVQYICHSQNQGYGANQKTCYQTALKQNADIIIMIHADYQYSPLLTTAMAAMLISGHYDIILASRIIGDQTLRIKQMPWWKYLFNRLLTLYSNIIFNYKISEYHTGFRAYTSDVLKKINFSANSDDFIFDNELLAQSIYHGFRIGEISCPTSYHPDASSINFRRSLKYGLGILRVGIQFKLHKLKLFNFPLFSNQPKRPTSSNQRKDTLQNKNNR